MNLEDLEIFLAVVATGGISRAAARLRRVPSNVTTRIQQLEQRLGARLFEREKRRLVLTAQGRMFHDYAERILRLAVEARDALHDTEPRGVLHLGAMDSVAATRLPGPLAEYHRRHPLTSVQLVTGSTQSLVAQVLARQLEAAVVANPPVEERLDLLPLSVEELVLVAPAGHPPIRSPRDIRYHNCLAFGTGCAYRRRLEDWFARHDVVPSRISELGSYHAILGCVAAGMGVALAPRVILEQFPTGDSLSIHQLPASTGRVVVSLIWRKQERSSRINAFIASLESCMRMLPATGRTKARLTSRRSR